MSPFFAEHCRPASGRGHVGGPLKGRVPTANTLPGEPSHTGRLGLAPCRVASMSREWASVPAAHPIQTVHDAIRPRIASKPRRPVFYRREYYFPAI